MWGNNVREIITKIKPYISDQIHLKDGVIGDIGNTVLGEGDGDFEDTVAALADIKFSGYFILENNYQNHTMNKVTKDRFAVSKLYKKYFN
jgi:sugar phosphate isomerase/epimerase